MTLRLRLLEIGCGNAVYIRHAAAPNPELTAVGLELQPEVAAMPRHNLATLHNNIYCLPVDERVALLSHVRGFLSPGGRLRAPGEMTARMEAAGFTEVRR